MNITFFTLFTVNFKLKGSFNLTFSFPSHYKHSWLLWKDTIQFHLVYIIAHFILISTKIKHFLGEDGFILYKIDCKSANITLKNIPWDDPIDPVPLTDIFYSIKTHSLCLLLHLPEEGKHLHPDVHELLTLHLKDNFTICTK